MKDPNLSRFAELPSETWVQEESPVRLNVTRTFMQKQQLSEGKLGYQHRGQGDGGHVNLCTSSDFILNCKPDANMPQLPGR